MTTKQDKTVQPDINSKELILIIYHDYESEITDKESYLSDLVSAYLWLRGDVLHAYFKLIENTFKDFIDLEDLNKMFSKGQGYYFFKAQYEPPQYETCSCGCCQSYIEYGGWYEFELIDFKPLEE